MGKSEGTTVKKVPNQYSFTALRDLLSAYSLVLSDVIDYNVSYKEAGDYVELSWVSSRRNEKKTISTVKNDIDMYSIVKTFTAL